MNHSAIRWIAIAAAEITVGIHVALAPMHLDEKFYIGVLFCIGSGLLTLAAFLLTERVTRPVGWLLGAVVNLGMIGGFIASRTVGLPLGYHETWASQPEDLLGLATLAAEAVFVICAVVALTRHRPSRTASQDRVVDLDRYPVGASGR